MANEHFYLDLKDRVPEYQRGRDGPLDDYLDVCSQILDEMKLSIEAFDYYKDYKYSAEKRLSLIARRFAFDMPVVLEEDIVRMIIRDLTEIYRTNGIRNTIEWVMRILTWDAEIGELWLVFPERYQEKVRDVYPQFYSEDGLSPVISEKENFIPLIGQGYRIGIPYQTYAEDSNRIVDGELLIGENQLLPEGANFQTDPFSVEAGFAPYFDVDRVDIRNFVTGRPIYRTSGVYFQGRTIFSPVDNLFDLRILGEVYPNKHIRREEVVMKTPYLTVQINSEDYQKFVDESYTEKETLGIASKLINFLLYDVFRPINVKFVTLLNEQNLSDSVTINEEEYDEILFDTNPFVESNPYYFPDAPSYQHYDSVMAIVGRDDDGGPSLTATFIDESEEYGLAVPIAGQSTDEYNYTRNITTTFDGSNYVSNEVIHTRTPSTLSINSDTGFSLEYKEYRDSTWTPFDNYVAGITDLKTFHVYEVRLVFAVQPTTVTVDTTWLDQTSETLSFPFSPSITPV